MLNIFCSDSAFNTTESLAVITHGDTVNKFGLVNSKILNYFYLPASIKDERSVYFGDNRRNTFGMFGSSDRPYGQMEIFFDNNLNLPDGVIGNNITTEEDFAINVISANVTKKNALFAIIEHCFLYHMEEDLTLPSVTTLNSNLIGSTVMYGGYVDGSIKVSPSSTNAKFLLNNKVQTPECAFYDWVSFQFYIDASHTVEIKVWLSSEKFLEEYPNCIMTKMVAPCDPQNLFTMTSSNIIEAISDSAVYSGNISSSEITKEDHTGMTVFKTRYVNQSNYTNYVMPFEIFYKGKAPTTSQQRNFVRISLETLYPNINSLLWKEILPDLFVEGSFFIVPFYANRKDLSSTESTTTVDLGITKYQSIADLVHTYYPEFDTEFIDENGVLCNVAGSNLQVMVFPDMNNAEEHRDLRAEHPSYIAVDAQNEQFLHMTSITRIFAEQLSTGLKIAMGLMDIPRGSSFVNSSINGLMYVVFACNGLEYYILKQINFQ